MKKFLTEFDELQDALKHVKMDEEVMPYVNGRLVENAPSYRKIQMLLNCEQMAEAHKFLYDMDVENISDEEEDKINKLFDLGVKNGYIDNSFEEQIQKEENPDAYVPDEETAASPSAQSVRQSFSAGNPGWTVLYSATKNGETKCGECYSNAISVEAARADCSAKLARFGYENISILAIEAGDPSACGCDNIKCDCQKDAAPAEEPEQAEAMMNEAIAAVKRRRALAESVHAYDIDCVYSIKGRLGHKQLWSGSIKCKNSNHMIGILESKLAKANDVARKDIRIVEFTYASIDGRDMSKSLNESLSMLNEGNNPYIAGMKTVTDKGVKPAKSAKSSTKKIAEADDDADDTSVEDASEEKPAEETPAEEEPADDASNNTDDDSADDGNDNETNNASDEETSDNADDDASDEENDDTDDASDEENDDTDDASDEEEADKDFSNLSDDEKSQYKDQYRKMFRTVMKKILKKFDLEESKFDDLTFEQKIAFYQELLKVWKDKPEENDFMTDKERTQIKSVVINSNGQTDIDHDSDEESDEDETSEEEPAEEENSEEESTEETPAEEEASEEEPAEEENSEEEPAEEAPAEEEPEEK